MTLFTKLCHTIFFKWMKWSANATEDIPDKCILCVAPHTSNWDFVIGELYYHAIGRSAGFLMKREWFFFPLGCFFKRIGGIPVERKRHISLTDQLAQYAMNNEHFILAVTPEGTRSRVTTWKKGFYYVALKAGIPILLYAIDYKKKQVTCTKTLYPSGDLGKDMRIVMEYYSHFQGKYPENFALEEVNV